MVNSNTKINLYSENITKFIIGQRNKIIPLGSIEQIDYIVGVLFLTETNRYFKLNKINSHGYYLAYTFINLFNKIRLKITKSYKFNIDDVGHFILSLSSNIDYFNSRIDPTNIIKNKINNNLSKFQLEIIPILYELVGYSKTHINNSHINNSHSGKIMNNENLSPSNLADSTDESDLQNIQKTNTQFQIQSNCIVCDTKCYMCVVSNVLSKFFYILLQTAKFIGTGICNEPNLVRLSEYYANIFYTWLKSNDIVFLSGQDDFNSQFQSQTQSQTQTQTQTQTHTELYENYLNYKNKLNYSLIELDLGSDTIDEIVNWIDTEIIDNLSIKIK